MADEQTLTARWIFPVSSPPLEHGLLTIRGDRILAVEPHGIRKADIDFGDAAIVPGFVNAHTHLDLTGARGLTPPTADFVGWLRRVIEYRKSRTPERVVADVQSGIAESLRYGTTLLGDIAVQGASWDLLENAALRAVVFRELIGMSEERAATEWEGFRWWLTSVEPTETCVPGVSPHAPYSIAESLYLSAVMAKIPVAIHLAETRAEADLLGDLCGPFVPFLKELGAWWPDRFAKDAARFIDLSTTDRPFLFVHCNYLSGATLIGHCDTIIYCPRTHAAFGHPAHPFREFLAHGVRVALGTDSLASNPDLSVLGEARSVHSRHPDLAGDTLLRLATLYGAEALGSADETGSLTSGKSADFAVVSLPKHDAADPHELLFDSDLPVVETWFCGESVFQHA